MSDSFITLRIFNEKELIFDEAETKSILKFFFKHLGQPIDAAIITRPLQCFAQGLLVEAIDSTYALGYIEILWRASYNPGANMQKALAKIGKKAAVQWFKHATQEDLLKAKISSLVRDRLAYSFMSVFHMMLNGVAKSTQPRRTHSAHVRYGKPSKTDILWG